MNVPGRIRQFFLPESFHVDEDDRIAGVYLTAVIATLIGLWFVLLHRLLRQDLDQAPSLLAISGALACSLLVLRRRHLWWATTSGLWSLLIFLSYQCIKDDGVHDIAVFGFPGILVLAGLVLGRSSFYLFTASSLTVLGIIGYLETTGVIQNELSAETSIVGVIDLIAILAVTAIAIRLLADSIVRSLTIARGHQQEISRQNTELRKSEERYHRLFEAANDAIFIMSGEKFVDCNSTTTEMFRCTRSEILGAPPWEFSPPQQPDGGDSREKARSVIQAAMMGTPQRFYWKHRRKDGTLFDAEVSLNSLESDEGTLIQAFVRDITERRESEAALRESEERFRTLFESQGEGTGIVDENERFILCNPAAEAILGVAPGGLVGRSLKDFVTPEQWMLIQSQTRHRRDGKRNVYEMDVIRPDGQTRSLIVTATPRFQNGQYVGAFGVFRDMTEEQRLQQQLIQSQKIQSLGTLAGGVAHDFNNILSIILGYSTELERSRSDPARFADALRAISKAVGRGAALVQQILTFARKSEVTFVATSVPDLVRELVPMLVRTFPKVISFSQTVEENIPIINADHAQIHQALLNLCVNARDAMPRGGEIAIRLQTVSRDLLASRFPEAEDHPYLCIEVADTGTGMDEATKSRVFDPFFTTKETGKGTGLGLSVVYGIVQSHRGFVDVESTVGKGSTFRLYLPAGQTGIHLAAKEGTRIEVPRGSETVLLVEDEDALRGLMKSRLTEQGYGVIEARDGAEAVALFAQHKKTIALVFTDVGLPKLTGLDEFKRIRELSSCIPVIFAGGFLEPKIKDELISIGAETFFQKPYEPGEVLVAIRLMLDKADMSRKDAAEKDVH